MIEKIDFVVTWVNGNDPVWKKSKTMFVTDSENQIMNSDARYRDWEFMKYWFRAVEQNAPWVNKIFLITEGHIPEWLDLSCEKLVHIRHKDYIDEKYLPTFNSNVIELNISNIGDLSEYFVLFNDDMLINKSVRPEDFFEDSNPRDTGIFSPIVPSRGTIGSIVLNNVEIINDYFNARQVIKKNFFKFFNLKYGKHLIKNFCVLPWKSILGFYDSHIPVSYKKSTFYMVWEKEKELLEETSSHKFRTNQDINHWLMRYWQLCQGKFIPRKESFGKYYNIYSDLTVIVEDIKFSKHSLICLNDGEVDNFEESKKVILQAFQDRYPNKSMFEK